MPNEPDLNTASSIENPTGAISQSNDDFSVSSYDLLTVAQPVGKASMRYLLGAEIARGGMGAVHVAKDTAFDREIAIKVLLNKPAPGSGSASTRRFQDEARITGQLQHPGIPPVHDIGVLHDGRPFLAMKLIHGDTLEQLLKKRPHPSHDWGRFVAVFEQICNAVAYAHAHKIVHRDLKPANVMVGSFGEVQVMDWGLAKVLETRDRKDSEASDIQATRSETEERAIRESDELLTQAGSILGTPAYMPPEQAIGAIHEVDTRSDVFGLGGILAAILTGASPFVGDTAETTRVLAARGEVNACFDRLDVCGADPCLVALAKRCLAPRREDRPADAQAVASEVAALRAEADERARRMEVELAAENAASTERRKRWRVWLGASAAFALAVVGGLGAVLNVQRRANIDLAAANSELATKNEALNAERAKVEHRFELARKAIASFHTTVDEHPDLGGEMFRPLRKKLLGAAAEFYRELEGLLADESDEKSRTALADGFSELAMLTSKIGDPSQALAVYRKELALRRELAEQKGADIDARLAVSVAARRVGTTLLASGDATGALQAYEEARDIASTLHAEAPNNAVTQALAASYFGIGIVQRDMGQPEVSLAAYQQSRDLRKQLIEEYPSVAIYRSELADSHNNIANLLEDPAEALAAHEQARELRQKLVDDHPDVAEYQSDLALSLYNIANLLRKTELPAALVAHEKARDVRQQLANSHPAVNDYRNSLAASHHVIGIVLDQMGLTAESLATFEKSREVNQKLVDDSPANIEYKGDLARNYNSIAIMLIRSGQTTEALAAFEKTRDLRQKLADEQPAVPGFRSDLANTYESIGTLRRQTGKMDESLAAFEMSQKLKQTLSDEYPTNTLYKNNLASVYNTIANLHLKLGRLSDAVENLKKAVASWGLDPAPSNNVRFERARALAILASFGDKEASGVSPEDAEGFAEQATSILADAIQAGWTQTQSLREPEFDSLRTRPDFQQLQPNVDGQTEEIAPTPPPSP